ncbi:MAG: Protein containing DNA/RNA helicase [Gallionellaceae bacterium]|nr:MAG: Protein containing DNA/RNA helicase [Gallionellaceae bacterium]
MTWPIGIGDLGDRLNLKNDRISDHDAVRQLRTVSEILRKLSTQPGVVLADEVGMGKTFVALGVAMMAALSDRGRRPVVVMVPSSLHEKWPRDFDVFQSLAIKRSEDKRLSVAKADSGLEFFKLIDNETKNRPHIIFLKHGAFHLQNMDHWIRLALIKRAMLGMHLGEKRDALPRFAARLIRKKSSYSDPGLFAKLLQTPNRQWRDVINNYGYCLEDDPIPEAVQKIIESDEIDIEPLRVCIRQLPARESGSIDERLERTRITINDVLRKIWPATLAKAKFRSPLLILDEAHHLKNPATRLASLFVANDAEKDVNTITGALEGAFERMMFLTATPFQLGHHELLNVIDRFKGIAWKTLPQYSKERFEAELKELGKVLDHAQHRAAELDKRWQSLHQDDLVGHDGKQCNVEDWWSEVIQNPVDKPEHIRIVMRAFDEARIAMKDAELPLRQWVVRHLRDRNLPGTNTLRRLRLAGGAIALGGNGNGGLPVEKEALLPFLLAARAQAMVIRGGEKAGRATFAEGLASSYEAFLETRKGGNVDEEAPIGSTSNERVNIYVEKLTNVLPNQSAYAKHPKIAAVVECVLDLTSVRLNWVSTT